MKNNLLYIAMFLMILCLPFRGNENEVRWLWADMLWIPLVFIFISLMCVGLYLFKKERIIKQTLANNQDSERSALPVPFWQEPSDDSPDKPGQGVLNISTKATNVATVATKNRSFRY